MFWAIIRAMRGLRMHWIRAAGLAVLYAGVGLLGRALIIPALFIAPIRLSIGVAATALVLNPPSTWWIYLLALVPFHLWQRNPANSITIALQYFAANALGALVGRRTSISRQPEDVRRLPACRRPGRPHRRRLDRHLVDHPP